MHLSATCRIKLQQFNQCLPLEGKVSILWPDMFDYAGPWSGNGETIQIQNLFLPLSNKSSYFPINAVRCMDNKMLAWLFTAHSSYRLQKKYWARFSPGRASTDTEKNPARSFQRPVMFILFNITLLLPCKANAIVLLSNKAPPLSCSFRGCETCLLLPASKIKSVTRTF